MNCVLHLELQENTVKFLTMDWMTCLFTWLLLVDCFYSFYSFIHSDWLKFKVDCLTLVLVLQLQKTILMKIKLNMSRYFVLLSFLFILWCRSSMQNTQLNWNGGSISSTVNFLHSETLSFLSVRLSLPLVSHLIFCWQSGGLSSTHLNLSRAICRRCERIIFQLIQANEVESEVGKYLNRYCFFAFSSSTRLHQLTISPFTDWVIFCSLQVESLLKEKDKKKWFGEKNHLILLRAKLK